MWGLCIGSGALGYAFLRLDQPRPARPRTRVAGTGMGAARTPMTETSSILQDPSPWAVSKNKLMEVEAPLATKLAIVWTYATVRGTPTIALSIGFENFPPESGQLCTLIFPIRNQLRHIGYAIFMPISLLPLTNQRLRVC